MTASGVELPCSAPIVQMTAFGAEPKLMSGFLLPVLPDIVEEVWFQVITAARIDG